MWFFSDKPPFSQKGNHYSSTSHCDKFYCFCACTCLWNKNFVTLGSPMMISRPSEFESTFFWSFILKTCNFSLSFFSLSCYQGRKIFLTPCYIVTRWLPDWMRLPQAVWVDRKGDEDQNLSHGMPLPVPDKNKINSYWDCPGRDGYEVRRQGGWCVESSPWYLLVGGTIIWRKEAWDLKFGPLIWCLLRISKEVYCYSYHAKNAFVPSDQDAKNWGMEGLLPSV